MNLKIQKKYLELIRRLDDFDLTMLLSEINDNGWEDALKLLKTIEEVIFKNYE